MPEAAPKVDFIERWREMVLVRREQHEAAGRGGPREDYWAHRAAEFHRFSQEVSVASDPLIESLLRHLRPGDTVLDVGAGTGRHALRLASYAASVVAVDPSRAMLRFLREEAAAQNITNIDVFEGAWPNIADTIPRAEIVYSAHVVYPIEDVVPFLCEMDAHARRRCFLHLMVWQPWFDCPRGPDGPDIFEAVHHQPRVPQPTYMDAVNVLHQLGCFADVEIAYVENRRVFESLDDAVERVAFTLPAGPEPECIARLRRVLEQVLEPLGDGRVGTHLYRYPLATVWWEAGALS